MTANLNFYAGLSQINNIAGSGLGFYGANFASSVQVGAWQQRTFITNSAGTSQGWEANNVQYLNIGSGVLGAVGSGISVSHIPNYQSTLQIELTNSTPVRTQNAQLWIYDRSNINNNPSGLTCMVYESVHPSNSQLVQGSGQGTWLSTFGSGSICLFSPSPGVSGQYNNGLSGPGTWTDTTHDWYANLSASPSSIGSKSQFGLYFYVEYL